jgi:hypothetical protein
MLLKLNETYYKWSEEKEQSVFKVLKNIFEHLINNIKNRRNYK